MQEKNSRTGEEGATRRRTQPEMPSVTVLARRGRRPNVKEVAAKEARVRKRAPSNFTTDQGTQDMRRETRLIRQFIRLFDYFLICQFNDSPIHQSRLPAHSHSMVAGGLDEMS